MAILNFKGRNIYYDIQGEGKPFIILNGIMMSTKSWEPFVETFQRKQHFDTIGFYRSRPIR